MGNLANKINYEVELASWLTTVEGDATFDALFVTTKTDDATKPAIKASEIDTNAGHLWADIVDDLVRANHEVMRGARRIGNFAVGGGLAADANANAANLVAGRVAVTANAGASVLSTAEGRLAFGRTGNLLAGGLRYVHGDDTLRLLAGATERGSLGATVSFTTAGGTISLPAGGDFTVTGVGIENLVGGASAGGYHSYSRSSGGVRWYDGMPGGAALDYQIYRNGGGGSGTAIECLHAARTTNLYDTTINANNATTVSFGVASANIIIGTPASGSCTMTLFGNGNQFINFRPGGNSVARGQFVAGTSAITMYKLDAAEAVTSYLQLSDTEVIVNAAAATAGNLRIGSVTKLEWNANNIVPVVNVVIYKTNPTLGLGDGDATPAIVEPTARAASGAGALLVLRGGLANTTGKGGSTSVRGTDGVGTDQAGGDVLLEPGAPTGTGAPGVSKVSALAVPDGVTAPPTLAGWAHIYVDTADGDLKVKFGDGTVKTIATDT